jgi:TPR repeat protein
MRYLELAAGMGHPASQYYLSLVWRKGDKLLGAKPDRAKAAYFLQMAVEAEHDEALFDMADSLYFGVDGQQADPARALKLYEKAGKHFDVSPSIIHHRFFDQIQIQYY